MIAALMAAHLAHATPTETVWVGHQIVHGSQPVPFLGELETHTESYLLARVTRDGDTLLIEQRACAVSFSETFGVAVAISPETLRQLPETRIRFSVAADNTAQAEPWAVAWDSADIDGDSSPGATVTVRHRMCSGELHVASTTTSTASSAQLTSGGLTGEIAVVVDQQILGASRACLTLIGDEQHDRQQGNFAYVPVDSGVTCDDLDTDQWPVRAQ